MSPGDADSHTRGRQAWFAYAKKGSQTPRSNSTPKDMAKDVPMQDAAEAQGKHTSEVDASPSKDQWGAQWGDQDAETSDANECAPLLLQCKDSEPSNPFAEIRHGSPEAHVAG
eukprot:6954744-Karenia_brevis.AAC.1